MSIFLPAAPLFTQIQISAFLFSGNVLQHLKLLVKIIFYNAFKMSVSLNAIAYNEPSLEDHRVGQMRLSVFDADNKLDL